jgi:hypothetical protein
MFFNKPKLSDKQLAANRANAQRSTGPKTEEGKRRSSLNARRHNLTGQVTAMTEEDRIAHDAFSESLTRLSHFECIFDYFRLRTGVKVNACNRGKAKRVAVKTYPL